MNPSDSGICVSNCKKISLTEKGILKYVQCIVMKSQVQCVRVRMRNKKKYAISNSGGCLIK